MFFKGLFYLFCLLVYSILGTSSFDVKITKINQGYLNGDYVNLKTFDVGLVDVNSTYARIPLDWDIIQNFPKDTMFRSRVIRYDSPDDRRGKSLDIFEIKVCDLNDPLYPYLPPFLIELSKSGNCIQKGNYSFYDAGQIRFYDLIPTEELKGAYKFNVMMTIEAPRAFINKIDMESVPV